MTKRRGMPQRYSKILKGATVKGVHPPITWLAFWLADLRLWLLPRVCFWSLVAVHSDKKKNSASKLVLTCRKRTKRNVHHLCCLHASSHSSHQYWRSMHAAHDSAKPTFFFACLALRSSRFFCIFSLSSSFFFASWYRLWHLFNTLQVWILCDTLYYRNVWIFDIQRWCSFFAQHTTEAKAEKRMEVQYKVGTWIISFIMKKESIVKPQSFASFMERVWKCTVRQVWRSAWSGNP